MHKQLHALAHPVIYKEQFPGQIAVDCKVCSKRLLQPLNVVLPRCFHRLLTESSALNLLFIFPK